MLLTEDGRIIEVVWDEPEKELPLEPVNPRTSYLLRNHHPNGQLAEEAVVINGNVEGIKKQWYPNGRMSLRISFRRGIPQGPRHMWNENGKLIEEEFYVNGNLDGVCRKFTSEGKIILESHYAEGLLHGRNRIWFPNGQLQHEEVFFKGYRNLTQKEWYSDGNIKCIAEYKVGQLDGSKKCWHRNGRLKSEEVFLSGGLNGVSRCWDAEGRIKQRFSHLSGRLHGEQIQWNEKGEETFRAFYSRGVRIPARYEALILDKTIHAKHILGIKNAEVRRVCLEALGYAKFLSQVNHKIINRDGEQELITILWHAHEEPLCLVKVKCLTTGAFYVLRVPPNMRTVKQAVAWTFGLNEKEYQPVEEA